MYRRFFLLIIILFASSLYAQRQSVLKSLEELKGYQNVPQEKVFLHFNTSMLFSGEYLYYSLYCFNEENNLLSNISKIAYVELLNEKKEAIFKHKIRLENGLGQGDFFLPITVPSGNYKLIGYTQWMLNSKKDSFFQGDLSILNPYQGDQKAILAQSRFSDSITNQNNSNKNFNILTKENTNNDIKILLDKQAFGKRDKVKLVIDQGNKKIGFGNYSISIRKKSSFKSAKPTRANEFLSKYPKINKLSKSIGSSFFLPEMRGELIYGKVISKESDFSVSNLNVALSIPSKNAEVKIVSTNKEGIFKFNLNKVYKANQVVIQVLGKDKNEYTVELFEIPRFLYPEFDFYDFKITKEAKNDIVQRSVYNQIENSFFNLKPDTIQVPKDFTPFYGNQIKTYYLDDYTRFSTVKETIVEIVNGVWIRKNEEGDNVFAIRGYYSDQDDSGLIPMVLVDGILIQEHEDIINLDARKVKSISFLRNRYFLGTKIYEGILVIETLDGDYVERLDKNYIFKSELSRPQARKNYYQQRYDLDTISFDRIPDYRYQLLWKPGLRLNKNSIELEFFTSDVTGDFEISLEGFSDNGMSVSINEYFKVN